jgi:uncharacterized membrane protein YoaK (UPF0700 family)
LSEPGRLRRLLARPGERDGPLVPLLFALTFLTGVVDAASYLKLGHVFVANMTGNVVFLGFAIAGAGGLSAASSLIALASFLLGASLGGRLGTRLGAHRGRLLRAGTTLQAALVAIAALIALAAGASEPTGVRYAITALLAVGMGIQNSAAQRLAVPELTTTVLTRTLTGLAADSASPDAHPGLFRRRLGAVAAMLLGALAGALLALEVSVAAGLGLAGAIAIGVAVAAHLVSRGRPAWARP